MANAKKELYDFYKSHGICVICGQEYAEPNRVRCIDCLLKQKKKPTEQAYKHTQWLKRRRDLLYAFGVCVQCGKRNAVKGRTSCNVCLAKSKQRSKNKRLENGVIPREIYWDGAHCAICGLKLKSDTQHKICEKCYPKYKNLMLHARESRKVDYFRQTRNNMFD